MVGRALQKVMPDAHYLSTKDCNLTKYSEVERIFEYYKPKYVIHLAAKVSGMKGNMDALGTHFTQNIGVPDEMVTDGHKSMIGPGTAWRKQCSERVPTSHP